jgi:hypothetical protein
MLLILLRMLSLQIVFCRPPEGSENYIRQLQQPAPETDNYMIQMRPGSRSKGGENSSTKDLSKECKRVIF